MGRIKAFSKGLSQQLESTAIQGPASIILYGFVLVFSFCLLASRKPDALFNGQFYAEDGATWFQAAYNIGAWKALFIPYAGYLHVFPRLFAGLALNIDLLYVPTFLNVVALSLRSTVVFFLLSSRLPLPLKAKIPLALLYVGLPGAWEVHGNISNSYIHLALLAFLILIAEPNQRKAWFIFDVIWLTLSALTGPFCIFLVPISLYCYLKRRKAQSLLYCLITSLGAVSQALYISQATYQRPTEVVLVPHPDILFKVLFNQIFSTSLLGLKITSYLNAHLPPSALSYLALLVGIGAIAIVIFVLCRASDYQRLFLMFAIMLTVAAFWSSVTRMGATWEMMIPPGSGGRYYFLPKLAVITSLSYLLLSIKQRLIRYLAGGAVVGLLLVGMAADWSVPPFPDTNYRVQVENFDLAPVGKPYTFNIFPPGWSFILVKR